MPQETDAELLAKLQAIWGDLERNYAVVAQAISSKKLTDEDKMSLKKYTAQVERWNENLTKSWRLYLEATAPQPQAPQMPMQPPAQPAGAPRQAVEATG